MWLSKVVGIIDKIARTPSELFWKAGGWFLAGMMFLTAADVFSRNAINKPIIGALDLTEFMMAIMVTSGLAWVAVTKSNINADVFLSRLSRRSKIILNIFTDFMSLIIAVLMTWHSFSNMFATKGFGLASSILKIPIWPFMGIVGVGFVMLILVLIRNFLELFLEVNK